MKCVFVVARAVLASASVVCVLSGCVGAGTVTTRQFPHKVAPGGSNPCPKPDETGEITWCEYAAAQAVTPDSVKAMWGEPKSDKVDGPHEELVYNRSVAWRGATVFVGIAIPLVAPVGHNETTLDFTDGHLDQVIWERADSNDAVCGLHSEGPDPVGCVTHW